MGRVVYIQQACSGGVFQQNCAHDVAFMFPVHSIVCTWTEEPDAMCTQVHVDAFGLAPTPAPYLSPMPLLFPVCM